MDEIKEMLKAVINGQHALRKEFSEKFKELKQENKSLRKEMTERFDGVDERLDKQGKHLAYLEDYASTQRTSGNS